MINCLIVDDEPIARDGMLEYIRAVEYLTPVAECKSAVEAVGLLQTHRIDLIFLDIQMPRLTGIDFLKALAQPPLVIFTTAYAEYALEGFELDVVDYLLKPIPFARFLKAVEKARTYLRAPDKEVGVTDDFFFIKSNGKIEKIMISDLRYIEARANYVVIHTLERTYITYLTLHGIEEALPADMFIRIHKSYLVPFSAVQNIDGSDLNLDGQVLPISKSYRADVMAKLEQRMFKR